MTIWIVRLSGAIAVSVLLAFGSATAGNAQTAAADWTPESCGDERIPAAFESVHVEVNGTRLHAVVGGDGPDLVLLHGFPKNWSAWAQIMPRLADRFRVVAVDLRGIGQSLPTEDGYDIATMAEDVHLLAEDLRLDRPYVVGSDFGGWVAYALARLHPETTRGVMVVDVPIAGVEPWESVRQNPALWHFGFHNAPGLAERLLAGREHIYIDYFLKSSVADPQSVSNEDVRRYACAYARPGRMEAAMSMYRAFDENERFGQAQRGPLHVPVSLVVGETSFGPLLDEMARGLEEAGVAELTTDIIPDAGHYPADERPAEMTAIIGRYASSGPVDDRSPN